MWTWKPETSGKDIETACDMPIFPRTRGRRHSFPPPSSYSVTGTPKWGPRLPPKQYARGGLFTYDRRQLQDHERLLPGGQLFVPPVRNGDDRHDFSKHKFWKRKKPSRRMSGGFESILSDPEKTCNPAFIVPYHVPKELVPAGASVG